MSVNRKTIAGLVLLTVTAAFSTASISTNYGKPGQISFVGTYYTEGAGTLTLHSDGTTSGVFANMFSQDPAVNDGRRTTPSQGIWRKIDKNTVEITTIIFATEPQGDNFFDGGFTLKTTYVAVFDKPVKGVSQGYQNGPLTIEAFAAGQNPITDPPIAVFEREGGRAYRLTAK